MEREDIYDIIRYGRKLHLRVVMATCGYLIDDESIRSLKKAGISALSFSLDGAEPETHDKLRQSKGAFASTIAATEAARRAGVRFQINTTISRLNIDEFVGIAELAKRLGAYCFNPFILVPTGRGSQLADEILEPVQYEAVLNELLRLKLESNIQIRVTCGPGFARLCRQEKVEQVVGKVSGCMGGREFGFISYSGSVQTCGFLDKSAGNLVRNGFDFEKIWLGSRFLKEIRNRSAYKGNCGICEYVTVCGGCRARAFAVTGDYMGPDPVCRLAGGEVKDASRKDGKR
jgi:radical SAM protein with 4Fe4S-binding SPASM domain